MSSTGLTYNTPAYVRAIPAYQWEAWIRNGDLPILEFDHECLNVVAAILKATRRWLEAQR
jgi:hypothetical protein